MLCKNPRRIVTINYLYLYKIIIYETSIYYARPACFRVSFLNTFHFFLLVSLYTRILEGEDTQLAHLHALRLIHTRRI